MKYLILSIVISLNLFSQDENLDKLPYDDAPPGVEENEYFALGAGYGVAFKFAKIDEINSLISNYNLEEIPTPLVLNGGMMFYSLPFWVGSRVSIWSFSGVSEEKNNDAFASLPSSHIGLGFDYGYVIIKTLALVGGLNISLTSIEFEISSKSEGAIKWGGEEILSKGMSVEHKNYHFSPNIGLEWAITDFLMFRLNGAYNISLLGFGNAREWTINNIEERKDIFQDVSNDGLVVSAGIFIGLFNY